jgi:hypothetical protein
VPTVDVPAPDRNDDGAGMTYRDTRPMRLLAVVGAISEEVALGLRANGISPVIVRQPPVAAEALAIFAPEQGDVVLSHLISLGKPVITDGPAEDLDHVSRMVALGVADVVSRPVRVDQLISKLERAIKKAARKR